MMQQNLMVQPGVGGPENPAQPRVSPANTYQNPYQNIKKPFVMKPIFAPVTETPAAQAANPYQKYKEQSLTTMSQGELLVKLYDELIKQMRLAALTMEKGSFDAAQEALYKSESILNALDAALDLEYDIAKELRDYYIFIAKQLLEASTSRQAALIEGCIPLLRDLRDSFDQAEKISRKEQYGAHLGSQVL